MRFGLDNRSYVGWFKGGWYLGSDDSKGLAYLTPPDLMRHDAHALHATVVNALRGRAATDVWSDPFVRLLRICEAAIKRAQGGAFDAKTALSFAEKAFGVEPAEHEARGPCGPAQCPHCYTRPDPSDARACCPRVHEEREASTAQRRARFDREVTIDPASLGGGETGWVAEYCDDGAGLIHALHPVREGAIEALWAMLEAGR